MICTVTCVHNCNVHICLDSLQELCQRPKFIADNCSNNLDGSRFDIELGELGDAWLLAAISSLTLTPRFLDRVVPPDQSFDANNYCGLFRYVAIFHHKAKLCVSLGNRSREAKALTSSDSEFKFN